MQKINNFLHLSYLDNMLQKTVKPLTCETLENLMTSEKVNNIMSQIASEPDEKKQQALKHQLPCALYHCQYPEDGKRPMGNTAVPSGFCMHDWDNMPLSPSCFYLQQIAGREKELGIVLAHITPRGKGLRLVTTMLAGERIPECQQRIAQLFGMEKYADTSIKDLSRLSFIPSKDYVLYLDEVTFFNHTLPETNDEVASKHPIEETNDEVVSKHPIEEPQPCSPDEKGCTIWTPPSSPSQDADIANRDTCSPSSSDACPKCDDASEKKDVPAKPTTAPEISKQPVIADSFEYKGIKYSAIINALLQRIATQGMPREGERNTVLFTLVRELRHICNNNFNTVYMLVSPYFPTLPDREVRKTISSAIATSGRGITPVLRGIIDELKSENIEIDSTSDVMQLPKLPKLSDVEEMILSKYPKHLRAQVFQAMLPIWGTYGTHIRFDYLDGRENSLSFMTAVVGKSGSGKAFAADLYNKMTRRFALSDKIERDKADRYLDAYNKAGDGAEKPDDPRPKVRLYGDNITTSQMLEHLKNLDGEHGLQFTEEVSRLSKAKRSIWGDNDDLYCKAFDNGIGGKESKSKQTRNIHIPIYLNTLFAGTPDAMHKFYDNPEGGLNNRVIYTFMPNKKIKGFVRYAKFSEADQQMFDDVAERLWQAGQDGVKVQLPWLERCIIALKSKWDKEDDENPDNVWYDLGKRSLVVAFRTGVLQWFLRGCPDDEKSHREINRVVRWMAEAMRQEVYAFCGSEYEKIEEKNVLLEQQTKHNMTKNKKLFSLLPEAFSTNDIKILRAKNGDSTNVYTIISRWKDAGWIISDYTGHYQKVTELSA